MRTINFRRLSATTVAIAATAALSLGGAQTEAWGGKSTNWEISQNAGKSTNWEASQNAGKSTNWELTTPQAKSTNWE